MKFKVTVKPAAIIEQTLLRMRSLGLDPQAVNRTIYVDAPEDFEDKLGTMPDVTSVMKDEPGKRFATGNQ